MLEFLGRLSEIAGNTEARQAQFAIEALGNLYVQANLLENEDLIGRVGSCGLLSLLEQVIGDSVTKIQSEKQNQNNAKVVDNCQTAIEQAYITLGEVCHFMCAGDPKLKALSKGAPPFICALAQKTVKLVLECDSFAPLMTIGIFRSASAFLKELSNDNKYTAGLWSPHLQQFVQAFPVSPENVDFFWSVVEFWLNVTYESGNFSAATLQLLAHRSGELQQMFGG